MLLSEKYVEADDPADKSKYYYFTEIATKIPSLHSALPILHLLCTLWANSFALHFLSEKPQLNEN